MTSQDGGKSYSTAGIKMVLKHQPEKCLLVYFLPTSMFTITSWVSVAYIITRIIISMFIIIRNIG